MNNPLFFGNLGAGEIIVIALIVMVACVVVQFLGAIAKF